ncbi:hypothetical protein D9619_012604 [Psilocybe cf. subviscida]|uniref:Cell wall protein n=1 Tax=Psilocybe cf. subviscida TaxID=2480587 RepID=A0A8H5EZH6_9AGAR|nr:hypothetical protein D9619_012604 [Psilocybe cf. subviscida]
MMHSFTSLLSFITMSALVATIAAAPVAFGGQLGNLACNVARLQTVTGIEATSAAVNKIPTAGNATVATALSAAKAGLDQSTAGVTTILDALFSGQDAPSDARNQVGAGFAQTQTALQGIASTGSATSKAVKKALAKLQKTINAGNVVVSQCGGGTGAAASAASSSTTANDSVITSVAAAPNTAAPASATTTTNDYVMVSVATTAAPATTTIV